MNTSVDPILDKAIAGERLLGDEIQHLFDHGGLLELGQAADAVRRQKKESPAKEASCRVISG
jgi:2-iminoacetate synthase ThiH